MTTASVLPPSTWAIRTDADGRTTYMLALVADTPEDACRFAREEAEPEIVAFAERVHEWLAKPSEKLLWVRSKAEQTWYDASVAYGKFFPEHERERRLEENPFISFTDWVAQKICAHAKGEPLP